MSKLILNHNDVTVYRERGFEDAYNGRPKRTTGFPSEKARTSYLRGWRIGARERERAA